MDEEVEDAEHTEGDVLLWGELVELVSTLLLSNLLK